MSSHLLTDANLVLVEKFGDGKAAYERTFSSRVINVTCTWRSPEEQWELFKIGRINAAGNFWVIDVDPKTEIVTQIDGKNKKSKHNFSPSLAIDFCIIVLGKLVWSDKFYDEAGPYFERAGLVWGGNWPHFKDRCHVELTA